MFQTRKNTIKRLEASIRELTHIPKTLEEINTLEKVIVAEMVANMVLQRFRSMSFEERTRGMSNFPPGRYSQSAMDVESGDAHRLLQERLSALRELTKDGDAAWEIRQKSLQERCLQSMRIVSPRYLNEAKNTGVKP